MRRFHSILTAALVTVCASSSLPALTADAPAQDATAVGTASAARVNALADAYLASYFKHFPESATFYRIEGATHDKLEDNTRAGRAAWQAIEDDLLARLVTVDPKTLDGMPASVTYGVLREQLEGSQQARVCRNENWAVDQVWGWQIAFGELADAQPAASPEDRERALMRWRQVAKFIDNETANLADGLRDGYTAPQRNVDLVLAQIDELLAMAPEESPFFAPARMSDDKAFVEQWRALLRDGVMPAIARHRDYLRNAYRPRARTVIAVTANPDGEACYRALLRANTTLKYQPKEIFEAGQEAVSLREERMAAIGLQLYGTKDLSEIRRRLRDEESNRFATRDELMSYTTAAIGRARKAAPLWFSQLPRAEVVIKPVPEYQEESSTARYLPASDDGELPGTYYVNLFQPEKQSRGAVESIAFHETYPGHHLQIAIAQERAPAHRLLRYIANGGFNEGWARYSETLAAEMGLYSSELNSLEMLSGLPTGMVVDPGIHAMGWSRDQAIAYTVSKQVNMTAEEAGAYVDRIVVWPGQMVSYGAGELEIVRLRRQAETKLGKAFDVRKFHDHVLEQGAVPLEMLRTQIGDWVRKSAN